MEVTVLASLPEHLRPQAAALYWEAFGGKLGRVLGPDARAQALLARILRNDHCIAALNGAGELVGIAGFKTPEGSFAGGSWADLRAIYGPLGGGWRGLVLRLLNSDVDNDRFLVDGIAVARGHRDKGIGGQLLAALYREAVRRGYPAIRLDVIADNWRARSLYERQGFVPTRTEKLGIVRYFFGFTSATTMVRPLEPSSD